tara:strand:+ start:365 stop:1054 length:690 start_codon:yes stop_codon:yes gene_type:complete
MIEKKLRRFKRVKKISYYWYILIFLVLLSLLFVIIKYHEPLTNKETVRNFIQQSGASAPLVLIGLQLFQTIVPFMPGGIITLSGGYLFGFFKGVIYSTIGLFFGSLVVFFLSKRYGRPIFKKFANEKFTKNVDLLSRKYGFWFLFITRILPFFPHDLISYAIGTTSISKKDFVIATLFGFLIHSSIHNYIGDSLYKGTFTFGFYLALGFLGLSVILLISKNKIIKYLLK